MHPPLYAIAPMTRPITHNNALRLSLSPITRAPRSLTPPSPRCSHTPARRPKLTTGHRAERHAKTRWVQSQIGSSGHAAEILRVVWAGARGRADGRRHTHVRKTRPDKVPAPFQIQNIPSRPARAQHQWERRCVRASTPTGAAAGKARGRGIPRGRGSLAASADQTGGGSAAAVLVSALPTGARSAPSMY